MTRKSASTLTRAEWERIRNFKLTQRTAKCERCGAEFVTKLRTRTLCGGECCANNALMNAERDK